MGIQYLFVYLFPLSLIFLMWHYTTSISVEAIAMSVDNSITLTFYITVFALVER